MMDTVRGIEDRRFAGVSVSRDREIFQAACAELARLTSREGLVRKDAIVKGFQFEGERVPFINPQQGIFKPKQMNSVLSILTQYATKKAWYDDQLKVHEQIRSGQELVNYSFTGTDPGHWLNQGLRRAFEEKSPLIYFLGVAPGLFLPVFPCYVFDWDASSLEIKVGFGVSPHELHTGKADALERPLIAADATERRYAMQEVRARLHQAGFRQQLLAAYGGRCAISGLPEARLLDAAHIIPDHHPSFGQPIVINGLLLSKIHHTAFDANLVGIDPDYRIHVSGILLEQQDGPLLEALKSFHGKMLKLPPRKQDRPDRERLEMRWAEFVG